jgi:hypothetical protein
MVIFYLISDWNDTYQANYILFLDLIGSKTIGKIQDGVKIQNEAKNPIILNFGVKGQFSTNLKKICVCRLAKYVALAKTSFHSLLNYLRHLGF